MEIVKAMALTKNTSKFTKSNQVQKKRFILGASECYAEMSQAYNDDMTAAKLKAMILNESKDESIRTVLGETEGEGKSLKLTFYRTHTDDSGAVTEEVQHVALITSSDWNMSLTSDHIDQIKEHVTNEQIVQRTDAKSVLEMF